MIKENLKNYFWDVLRHHYADFSGKATPKQFWLFFTWWCVINFAILLILGFLEIFTVLLASDSVETLFYLFTLLILGIFNLGVFLPFFAIAARRFKDAGFSTSLLIFLFVLNIFCNVVGIISFISFYVNPAGPADIMFFVLLALLGSLGSASAMIVFCVLPSKKTN